MLPTQFLSEEELFFVFRFLPASTLISSCIPVNSTWKLVGTNNDLWENICSTLLMNNCFMWSEQLEFSTNTNEDDEDFWYITFRKLFYFPIFRQHVPWYQEEEPSEYNCNIKTRAPPPPKKKPTKKRKARKISDDSSDESSDDDDSRECETVIEYSLEIINRFVIPPEFEPGIELGLKREGEVFDFDMRYSHAKIATLLTVIGSELYSPNIWNDHLTISVCDSKNTVLLRTNITVAALCLCIQFDCFDDIYESLFDCKKSKTSKIGISIIIKKEPTCYVDLMDDRATNKNGVFEWICKRGATNWIPSENWDTIHGEFSEFKYRAKYSSEEENLLEIERHSIYHELT